jgi:hypothetical protein
MVSFIILYQINSTNQSIFKLIFIEEIAGFLRDSKSLNVALTRAKSSLWIFGSTKTLEQNDTWKALIEDAKDRGCYSEVRFLI